MRQYLKRFLKDTKGLTAVEYTGVIAVAAMLAAGAIALAQNTFTKAKDQADGMQTHTDSNVFASGKGLNKAITDFKAVVK